MRKLVWLLPWALLSLPAFAGERYTFSTEVKGGLREGVSTRQTLVDGNRLRIEPEPKPGDGPRQVTISQDGGESFIALLPEDRTYHNVKKAPASPDPAWSLYGLLPVQAERSVTGVELTVSTRMEPEQISGLSARRHDIRLSYDLTVKLSSETVRGKVRMETSFWMAEDYSTPLPASLRPKILTGFPEIDTRLTAELAKLRGLPVKRQTAISTEADRGTPPRSETVTETIVEIKKVETPSSLFEVPRGFRYEEPVFSGIGNPVASPPGS